LVVIEVSAVLSNERAGKVYLVGAGPGDPDLLTVRACRILQRAEVVLYDRLVSPGVLALANRGAELIYAGKNEGEQHQVQEWINDQLLAHARRGKLVVRLKGGDPLVFGRGAEEWLLLTRHGIEVELVPGLSSALAVPNAAGIPLTFRGLSRAFAVITGHCATEGPIEWQRYAAVDTLVILMGVQRRAGIAAELIQAGRQPDEPTAFIERGTTPGERVVLTTLADIAAGTVDVEPPAVFIVGRVVEFSRELMARQLEPDAVALL
jgi:uroporphyrin-III C-methyltransferase